MRGAVQLPNPMARPSMRRLALAVLFLLVPCVAPAGQRFVLRHAPLSESEQRSLGSRGLIVERLLSNGTYLVRGSAAGLDIDLMPLTPQLKVDRSVRRELLRAATPRIHVVFHEGVSLGEAREAIASAGGTLEDPLALRLGYLRQLAVFASDASIDALAADERVFMLYGAPHVPIETDNWLSAELSHVAEVHATPYDLTGRGVPLSLFEGGEPFTTHVEFEGRLSAHSAGGSQSQRDHATHVAGTIAAAGISSHARGMAPAATLHQFHATSSNEEWQITKDELLLPLGIVADNNSWSYVVGWTNQNGGFVWNGRSELWGAYDPLRTAAVDRIARERGILFVHSAGNDAAMPAHSEWVFHRHLGGDGEPDLGSSWCYSKDGSGRDCPQPLCSAGPTYCETSRHHPEAPFRTMSMTASAKNAISVGAVDLEKRIAPFSSRGPALDGRVKPDLVARGVDVLSTALGTYARKSGTSMAAPVVTGAAALLTEEWRRSRGGNPGPTILKALMIAGAEDLGTVGPDYTYGFGLLDAKASVDLIRERDHLRSVWLSQGERTTLGVTLAQGQRVRIVLQWLDREAVFTAADPPTAKALVDDLDLSISGPDGVTHLPYVLDPARPDAAATTGVNDTDNTEVVELVAPQAGTFSIVVRGTRIFGGSPREAVVVSSAPFVDTPVPPKRRSVGR